MTDVLSLLLAAVLLASALIKLTRWERFIHAYPRAGVPMSWLNTLAVVLLAGAAGLVVGLFWTPIGVITGACLVVYFIVAVGFHIRTGDLVHSPTPALLAVLAGAVLTLHLAD